MTDLSTPFFLCAFSFLVIAAIFLLFVVINLNSTPRPSSGGPSPEEIGVRFGAEYAYGHRNDVHPQAAAPSVPHDAPARLDYRDFM